jgi:hypothetical protein
MNTGQPFRNIFAALHQFFRSSHEKHFAIPRQLSKPDHYTHLPESRRFE